MGLLLLLCRILQLACRLLTGQALPCSSSSSSFPFFSSYVFLISSRRPPLNTRGKAEKKVRGGGKSTFNFMTQEKQMYNVCMWRRVFAKDRTGEREWREEEEKHEQQNRISHKALR